MSFWRSLAGLSAHPSGVFVCLDRGVFVTAVALPGAGTIDRPSMRARIDGLFAALQDARTMLEARDDIRALVGRIVVSPEADGGAALWLEGDLAGILNLASGTKTPAASCDGRVLTSMVAGAHNRLPVLSAAFMLEVLRSIKFSGGQHPGHARAT